MDDYPAGDEKPRVSQPVEENTAEASQEKEQDQQAEAMEELDRWEHAYDNNKD